MDNFLKQVRLFSTIDRETEKKIQKEVVSILKSYCALKVCYENELEQKRAGVTLFTELLDTKQVNQMKLRQIERTLQNSLDKDEYSIIQMKYLNNKKLKDDYIYTNLLMTRDTFYRKKKSAFYLIAMSLGII